MSPEDIVFVSGHHPIGVYFANETRKSFEKYTKLHGYKFYYNEEDPVETAIHNLHHLRTYIIKRASLKYPNAKWYIWVDSDVYVNKYDMKVEDQLDLTDENMLYHLFHERPEGCYPINTGVKFVNRKALPYEEEIWNLRNFEPWNTFPFEQKATYELILPKIPGKYKIHDPYVLNCIRGMYPDKLQDALFIHMCTPITYHERNEIMRTLGTS